MSGSLNPTIAPNFYCPASVTLRPGSQEVKKEDRKVRGDGQ